MFTDVGFTKSPDFVDACRADKVRELEAADMGEQEHTSLLGL
ncbi:hypothetical protein [Nocardia sp.]